MNCTTQCTVKILQAELPILLIFSTFANIIALATLLRLFQTLKLKTISLLVVLSGNDVIASSVLLVMITASTLTCDDFQFNRACDILGWIGISSFGLSMAIVAIISLERFLMVVYPIFHRTHVTLQRLVILVAMAAAISLVLCGLPLVGVGSPYSYYRNNRFCVFDWTAWPNGNVVHASLVLFIALYALFHVVVVIFCNCGVLHQLRQRSRTLYPLSSNANRGMDITQRKSRKFALLATMVAIVNTVFNTPFFAKLIVDYVTRKDNITNVEDSVTSVLLFSTPLANPLLYLFFNKSYRLILLSPFKRCGFCQRLDPVRGPTAHAPVSTISTAGNSFILLQSGIETHKAISSRE